MSRVNNVVVVSDTHCGCGMGLFPNRRVKLDEGGYASASSFQRKIWSMWREFWDVWVPYATRGEDYAVIFNGDAIDGVHHNSTTQVTHNLRDQRKIAKEVLAPIVDLCEGRYYHVRGTEAHVGKSAVEEEQLAEDLGAIPNEEGQFARYDIWKAIGPDDNLIHALHHIGTTGSQAYEATAPHKELVESFTEAGRWGNKPPDVIVRSHRHRCIKTSMPTYHETKRGKVSTSSGIAVTTPGWQGKTPFVWKIPGGRLSTPQFGGIVIRVADGELFVRESVWTVDRSKVV